MCIRDRIEGFYDICRRRGLTGQQGVIIPKSNVKSLMLSPEVVQATRDGKFQVWPVERVEEAISLLSDIPVGERDASGAFPDGSINARIETRLRSFHEIRRRLHDRS